MTAEEAFCNVLSAARDAGVDTGTDGYEWCVGRCAIGTTKK